MEKPVLSDAFMLLGRQYMMHEADIHPVHRARMIMARDVPVLSDLRQEEEGEWRGDHAFSSKAAQYSLMHFVEPEIAHEHPDWDTHAVQQEAKRKFFLRLEQDFAYETSEKRHEETSVLWHPIITREGTTELATTYGDGLITLRELWEHTKEFAQASGNLNAYNEQEAKAQLSMQEEMVRSSVASYVTVLSHPDSIRYVQVWEKSSDGGAVVSRQLDLQKTTGRDFTHAEGDALIEAYTAMQTNAGIPTGPVSPAYSHVFLKNSTIEEEQIRILASAISMNIQEEHETKQEYVRQGMPDQAFDMTRVGAYVGERIRERVSGEGFSEHIIHTDSIRPADESRIQTSKRSSGTHKNREQSSLLAAFTDWYITRVIIDGIHANQDLAHAGIYWIGILGQKNAGIVFPDIYTPSIQKTEYMQTPIAVSIPNKESQKGRTNQKGKSEKTAQPFGRRLEETTNSLIAIIAGVVSFRNEESQKERTNQKGKSEKTAQPFGRRLEETTNSLIAIVREVLENVSGAGMQKTTVRVNPGLSKKIFQQAHEHYLFPVSAFVKTHSEKLSRVIVRFWQEKAVKILHADSLILTGFRKERILMIWYVVQIAACTDSVYKRAEKNTTKSVLHTVHTPWLLLAIIRYLVLLHESGRGNGGYAFVQNRPKRSVRASYRRQAAVNAKQVRRNDIIFALAS